MRYFQEYTQLFSLVDEDTLILTPNRRLSRFISAQYSLFKKGGQAWGRLQCVSFQVWQEQLWGRLQSRALDKAASCVKLSSHQEKLLWQEIVREDSGGYELLVPERLADSVAEAWQHLNLWNLGIDDIPDDTEEAVLCKRWMKTYVDQLGADNLVDSHRPLSVLIRFIRSSVNNSAENDSTANDSANNDCFKTLQLPKSVKLVGFDDIPPQQQAFLDVLEQAGSSIEKIDIEIQSESGQLKLADKQRELEVASRWALAILQAAKEKGDEQLPLIGLVIPGLAQQREWVERILLQVFEPQYLLPDAPRHAPAFNISAAQNLADAPVISAALDILQLTNLEFENDVLSRCLLSPFIGCEKELLARAELDVSLRRDFANISLTILRTASGVIEDSENEQLRCPDLYGRLHRLHDQRHLMSSSRRKPSEWVKIFQEQLEILGWPGSRTLDTLEFQQAQIWPEVLENFAHLDIVSPQLTIESAIKQMRSLAAVPFQAQTRQSPIQVLGLLEAAGLQFDHLWVMNMDSRHWPEAPNPNSLLPVAFQRENAMPRSSVEKEFAFAQRLTKRLKHSATEVIFSWSTVDEDQELRPSPLIKNLPELNVEEMNLAERYDYSRLMFGKASLESIVDVTAPAVGGRIARGGTQILKDQAACGFKAFAKHRLNAHIEQEAETGIDGMQKGNLIHHALEIIWRELKEQKALLALGDEALDALIRASLESAWAEIIASSYAGKKLKSLELDRAFALLRAWMELEKQRPDFAVAFNETQRDLNLGGLKMRIRYDRVDRLADDGALAVIDYKTGEVNPKDWAGDRPKEPQVPIYCVAQADEVKAAAFGQLHASEVAFKGLSDTEFGPKGLVEASASKQFSDLGADTGKTWEAILDYWKSTLTKLANDYLSGQALVDPKSPEACRFCDLHGLCRVREVSESRDKALVEVVNKG